MSIEETRKIIHIDMDAFYASVEQRDNSDLKGKPVAVGGSSDRGVVAAASYEARKYGVHSAMPSKIAIRKCPHLIFVRPRFDVYSEVSRQIREIFLEYTDMVEPLSLDEAYLDVTNNKKGIPSATLIAKEIKSRILEATQLTASAGISINKFLAKTASDINKPDGITLIPPQNAIKFIEQLPVEDFFGIGKVTAKKMHDLGLYTGADMKQWTEVQLIKKFGKAGKYYHKIVRGIDNRKVNPNRIRKSVGAENTFSEDVTTREQAEVRLFKIADTLMTRMKKSDTWGKTITLKVKFSDFKVITRSKTVGYWINTNQELSALIDELLDELDFSHIAIRLLGLSVTNLNTKDIVETDNSLGLQLTIDY